MYIISQLHEDYQQLALSQAQFYAAQGWQVVVLHGVCEAGGQLVCTCRNGRNCDSAGKHPRLKDWPSHATCDADAIAGYWQRWPASNVGVRLGPASRIIDCEYDCDEGKATAERLLGQCRTPAFESYRSTHRIFRFPEGLTIPKAVAKAQGLELRFGTDAKGSQSVFPPSVHAAGLHYRWLDGLSPDGVEPLPFPDSLAELMAAGDNPSDNGKSSCLEFVCEGDLQSHLGSPKGQRHETLCRLVGRYLAERGPDADLLVQALAWGERCQPAFPASEVQKVVAGLAAKEFGKQNQSVQPTASRLSLESKPFAEIAPQRVNWLWPGRFAFGKLSLLVGQPGLGKTFLACDMLATVSRHDHFPDGSTSPICECAILTAEDGAADTLRPRLDAHGANVANVHHIEGIKRSDGGEVYFSLGEHLALLDEWLTRFPKTKLLIVDPISAFLGKLDSHHNSEVRGVLGPVAKLADTHGVAIIGVTHLAKGQARAINRVIGSIAFVAAARAAWLVAADPDDESGERRLFLPVKNNLARTSGLAFSIVDGRLAWDESPVLVSADEIDEDDTSPREEAMAWLRVLLSSGPIPAAKVLKKARADGIAERTLKRAKRELGVVSERDGEHWAWRIPGESCDDRIHEPDEGVFIVE